MDVCCESCVLSGRGLCDGLITRREESYRLWRVVVCDQETSRMRRLKPATGMWKIQPQWVVTPRKQTNGEIIYVSGDNVKKYSWVNRVDKMQNFLTVKVGYPYIKHCLKCSKVSKKFFMAKINQQNAQINSGLIYYWSITPKCFGPSVEAIIREFEILESYKAVVLIC